MSSIVKQQRAEEEKSSKTADPETCKEKTGMDPDFSDRLEAPAQSPLPEAEYDKLLVTNTNCFYVAKS